MKAPRLPARALAAVVPAAVVLAGLTAGCSGAALRTTRPSGPCPGRVVDVVVSVNQWGDIVERLGGDCARVTTVLDGSAGDPHDFEMSPGAAAAFDAADLVVLNGGGYDEWAGRTVAALDPRPAVVDAGDTTGLPEGSDPHFWNGPDFVRAVAEAVTGELGRLSAPAIPYFEERHDEWVASLGPYDMAIARIRTEAAGTVYGATEPVFDHMADALGLVNGTPSGYRAATEADSGPAPGDVTELNAALQDHRIAVLIHNTQTESPSHRQVLDTARNAGVPVVGVTETLPPGAGSFVEWQVSQLTALATALGL